MNERMAKREAIRLAATEERRKRKELSCVQIEDWNCIINTFNGIKCEIESKASQISKDTDIGVLNDVMTQYDSLKNMIQESSVHIPAYHLKMTQSALKSLKNLIDHKKEMIIPKFNIELKSVDVTDGIGKCTDDSNAMPKCVDVFALPFYGFRDVSKSPLMMGPEMVNGKEIQMDNLNECVVEIYGAPLTLHMSNLRKCQVFVGPVTTSVFLDNCHDCTFHVAAQQLRIHTSSECDFYLHVTSRAIIEDSTKLRFAPYKWHYPQLDEHFKFANLNVNVNNWDKIDDFNWLMNGQSPNWTLMDSV